MSSLDEEHSNILFNKTNDYVDQVKGHAVLNNVKPWR